MLAAVAVAVSRVWISVASSAGRVACRVVVPVPLLRKFRPWAWGSVSWAAAGGSCRGPEGCSVDAEACDLDHVRNHDQGGMTAPWNLQALCRRHHLMKTRGDLRVRMDAAGVCVWTYPGGDEVTTYPQGPLTGSGKLFAQSFAQRRAQRIHHRRQASPAPRPAPTHEEPPF